MLFYSICAVVPVFITRIRNKENECTLGHFRLKKAQFSCCLIQNWEELEFLKNEKKSWKSPGILFFPFSYEP